STHHRFLQSFPTRRSSDLVTVTTSGGTSSAVPFTIAVGAPTLASISPNSAVAGAAVPVTLTGTNFISGATVATTSPDISVSNVSSDEPTSEIPSQSDAVCR